MTAPAVAATIGATALGLLALAVSGGLGPARRLPPGPTGSRRARSAERRTTGHRAIARRMQVRARRPAATIHDCIAVVDRVARDLRSGSSPTAAIDEALAAHPHVLIDLRRQLVHGCSVGLVVEQARAESAHERLVLHALRASRRAAGSGASVFERAGETLREHRVWTAERRAQTAQARLSARVLTAVPIVFACWGIASDDGVRRAYASSPLPAISTAAGLALNVVGWWWMRRLTRGGA